MNILVGMKNWIKAVFLWLLVKENRAVGLYWTKKSLDLFEVVTRLTKTKKDDKIVACLEKQVDRAIKINGQKKTAVIASAAKFVTDIAVGSLKNVELGVRDGKPAISFRRKF